MLYRAKQIGLTYTSLTSVHKKLNIELKHNKNNYNIYRYIIHEKDR